MSRKVRHITIAGAMAATAAFTGGVLAGPAGAVPPVAAKAPGNVVVEWNQTLLSLVQTPGAQPATIQPTRDFAIMSAAVYNAVDAITGTHAQYRTHLHAGRAASRVAAAAQAAHDVLVAMFPASAGSLDGELSADLAAVAAGPARAAGVEVGAEAARDMLALRANDGATATPPPYQTTGAAGDYRPTPPGFAAPVFTHWGAVTPFVLRRGDQYRPAPPPALDSPQYAAAISEAETLGRDTSTIRTNQQTTIAKFWAGPIQNYWNAITDEIVVTRHANIDESARTLALLDLGVADATIALYDAKYTYRLWRPVTAIRLADTDGNPLTTADPTWTPLATTPPDPSYPGAHSTVSSAAATILTSLYGNVAFTVTSPVLPGVTRTFGDFHDAVSEAGQSRIYAGIHTRLDHEAGLQLGRKVARFALKNVLK